MIKKYLQYIKEDYSIEDDYKVGDYILIDKYNDKLKGKIIEIDSEALNNSSDTYFPAAFAVIFLDKLNDDIYPWIRKDQIIRKLKDDEIPEAWKVIDNTNKYNL